MDDKIRTAYEAHRGVPKKQFASACYAPYTSLYFHTNGDVISCCKNTSYVLGNIAEQRLSDIWHGKRTKALRKALSNYNFKLGCEFCEWQIQAEEFDQVYTKTFDHLPLRGEEPEWPSMLEFTVSNTCNLACIMCYGELSSTIRAQRENLPPLPKVYDDRFFEDLRAFLPHLKVAKFFGGEPFLARENYRIWDMMIEDGISIPIHVTTNGTQWNKKVQRILDHFPTSLSISVDGATKETAESIRINMNFETVTANVEKFLAYTREKGTYLGLTYCLMRQNWHEFGDYLKYGEDLGVDVFINTVVDPKDCSLYTLDPAELSSIVDRMEQLDAEHGFSELPNNGARWRSAVSALRQNANDRQKEDLGELRESQRKLKESFRPDHLSKAWQHIIAGEPEQALEEVRKVRDTDKEAYEARVLEGRALRDMKRYDEALIALEGAIEMWHRGPLAYVERSWTKLDQGELDEALQAVQHAEGVMSATNMQRAAPAVFHARSAVEKALGNYDKALEYADHLIAAEGRDVFFIHRAYLYGDVGRHEEQLADVERVLAENPSHGEALAIKERALSALDSPAR